MASQQKTLNKARSSIVSEQFNGEIANRAKEIYLKRQGSKVPGDALSDWLIAEKEIKAKHAVI